MGKYRRLVLASMAGLFFQTSIQAQENFVVLEKNHNFRAKDLIHELNSAQDTLILKGSDKIKYVYSINRNYEREIDTYAGTNNYRLPISKLSPGKHVLVVSHNSKLVVFVLKIFKNATDLVAARDSNSPVEEK